MQPTKTKVMENMPQNTQPVKQSLAISEYGGLHREETDQEEQEDQVKVESNNASPLFFQPIVPKPPPPSVAPLSVISTTPADMMISQHSVPPTPKPNYGKPPPLPTKPSSSPITTMIRPSIVELEEDVHLFVDDDVHFSEEHEQRKLPQPPPPTTASPLLPAPAPTHAAATTTAAEIAEAADKSKRRSHWETVRKNIKYRKGSIKALIGKDSDHLYHPNSYKRRASIEVDYASLRDSSKQLTGAVNFALAAIKAQSRGVKENTDEDGENKQKEAEDGVSLQNDQKSCDYTGQLLKRIGIAGMINIHIGFKRWASRSGIQRPLHFSRQLGKRMRRSSSVLSPLARETLQKATMSGMSQEARAKIKMRAVRAAAAGDITKRKKFLKSIALFQNFNEDTLNGIAKSLDYVVFIRGDIVIQQGQPGEKLFIIERGSVDVFVAEPGYDPSQQTPSEPGLPVVGRKVMRLSAGDPFGERALMQSKPRAASCVAVENTTCCKFSILISIQTCWRLKLQTDT